MLADLTGTSRLNWRPISSWCKTLFLLLLLACVPHSVKAQNSNGQVTFKVLRDLPLDLTIEQICCDPTLYPFSSEEVDRIVTHYGEGPIWAKIEGIEDSGLIQFTAMIDKLTMYFKTEDGMTWQSAQTGDIVPNEIKPIPTAFMAIPLPMNLNKNEVFVRIEQPTKISIKALLWQLPEFSAMQNRDRIQKTFLIGFVCAIILYNLVVSAIVRDLAYLLNAGAISSLVVTSLYLSGYGASYFWADYTAYSNIILCASIGSAIVFAAGFLFIFLKSDQRKPSHYWPLFVAPLLVVIISVSLTLASAPYWYLQLSLLICAALLFLINSPFIFLAAYRGNRKARALLFPFFFAMIPGLSLVSLNKIFGFNPLNLGDSIMELTLATEAVLFSLALASRIRITDFENSQATNEIFMLRKRNSEMALAAQDEERKRLAKELHDGVGQEMLVVVNQLKKLARKSAGTEIGITMLDTVENTTQALENIRHISRDMHPASIEHLGFSGTIQSIIDQMNTLESVEFSWDGDINDLKLNRDAQLHLVRIIQECFSNVIKHANASLCMLLVKIVDNNLCIRIDDDGIGIADNRNASSTGFGLGLTSINERVGHLNGSWRTDTSPQNGLSTIVEIPLKGIWLQPGNNDV